MEIKFNPSKTNFLAINHQLSLKVNKHLNDQITLKMYNEPVSELQSMRYLRFFLNNKLNNKTHINNRKQTAFLAIQELKESSSFFDQDQIFGMCAHITSIICYIKFR